MFAGNPVESVSDRPGMLHEFLTSCSAGLLELLLEENGIGSQGVRAVANFLVTNPSLEVLYLQNNRLVDADAEVLANALRSNSNLRALCLDGSQINEIGENNLIQAMFDTCCVGGLTRGVSAVNCLSRELNRAMKIFTILAASDESFFDVTCLGKVSYKLIPMVLTLAQSFEKPTPELSNVYEQQTGRKSADWDKLKVRTASLLLR